MLSEEQRQKLLTLLVEERVMQRELRTNASKGRVLLVLEKIPALVAKQEELDNFIEKEL